ncbi:MAG: glycosyltransferase family 2 protein [Gammaproteobacteria bacterium]|nr:glycosyltransferase family 2 protein [Gammaproteobacteria bacterium]
MTDNLSSPLQLSVFIIAVNEADRIQKAIESVITWADEVIVVDSGSKDNTVEIAEKCGATVIYNEWQGYGQQKRFGEQQCKHDWILNIDADERVTPALRAEIGSIFSNSPRYSGYKVKIVDLMPFEKMPHRKAWAVTQIRLYNKTMGRFRDHITHDAVVMDDDIVGQLDAVIHHNSTRSFFSQVEKLNRYSDMQARDMAVKGRKIKLPRLITEFPLTFVKAFFIRRYYIYGIYGFGLAMIFAFSKFLRLAKRYEQQVMEEHSS